ncbi:diguanylate cyclase domain-containing protein [Bradyrhizobium sp. SZCCHNPS2010]|uniref:sensor domain-containing diguanylate cyclase n=2 Tax=unclassified Bradyrhizobium TaxID=2631580 RepID=UPI002916BAF4|nr:diguanylate cyclase [Bradyrhizobium sp. SZCCHNPS2010]
MSGVSDKISSDGRGRMRLTPKVAGLLALACIAIIALSGWREWTARQSELRNAETDMANLAVSLSQHADDTFELADTVLNMLVNQLELRGTSPTALAELQRYLDRRKKDNRIGGVVVLGEDGRWLATSETVDLTGRNDADQVYFEHHRTSTDRSSLIGPPVKSAITGQWVITVSRRFNRPDGAFGGVALVTVDANYLENFYSQFNVGRNGSIFLMSRKGVILARAPDDGHYVGRNLSSLDLFKQLDGRPSSGTFHFTSPLDGRERVSFYQFAKRYPVVVVATEAKDELLASWRHAALIRMGTVLLLTCMIAAAGIIVVRQLRQREGLVLALSEGEADFRLIAEHSGDLITRIGFDGEIRYASPSSLQVIGWRPEQLVGTSALAGLNNEDLPGIQRTANALQAGEIEEARIVYRNRHREKGEIWIETALRVTRNRRGQIDGMVAISRDITEFKTAAEKLTALALSDGLTGLANRRHFDAHLKEECGRARREGGPLSLLLIDVDLFKKYNDNYGHQAGDDCLRAVARVLAEQAQRPADVAARYGGEEFALLLPGTDANGCIQVGERIRAAVGALGIPHDLNPPSRTVTLSLGGTTMIPIGEMDPNRLVDAADKALYAAKMAGRDRLMMSAQVVPLPNVARA